MMSLLFLLITLSISLAWRKFYRASINLFVLSLCLSFIWFLHHASSKLPLHF